jgi:predicted transglutaminase-like protease
MEELEEFLNYLLDNIDDPRIILNKKLKYGYRYYFIVVDLPTSNGRTLTVSIDNRSHIVELTYDYGESIVYESEEFSKIWMDKLEIEYQKIFKPRINDIINNFIDETETPGKDFWRGWAMNKIFKDDTKG